MPYYESHITVEPVFDERLEHFKALCKQEGFKAAELLMKKRRIDTPERSQYDTFCTGRAKTYSDLEGRMLRLLSLLQGENFQIWRYKVEHCILDSKEGTELFPLQKLDAHRGS